MAKKSHTVSKTDQAINSLLRDLKIIDLKDKLDIPTHDALYQVMNRPNLDIKVKQKDSRYTKAISGGFNRDKHVDPKEAKLLATAKRLNLPIELIRKHPNLKVA